MDRSKFGRWMRRGSAHRKMMVLGTAARAICEGLESRTLLSVGIAVRNIAEHEIENIVKTPSSGGGNNKSSRERAQLSQREREIIVLIAQGYKNKEIAEKMFITEQTVKNHLHNVFDKLGVSDRLELALYAIHNSLHVKV